MTAERNGAGMYLENILSMYWFTATFMSMKYASCFSNALYRESKSVKSAAKKGKNATVKKRAKKYARGSLRKGIFAYFDHTGIDAVTYEETARPAKKIKPDTKFDKSHFAWYRNVYKKAKAK